MLDIKLYAKYRQFLLVDDRAGETGDPEDGWTEQALVDRVAVADGWIAVGTDAACDVDIQVEIADAPPSDATLDDWDHVVEGSLEVTSARIIVMSPGEPLNTKLGVPPGWWRVRAHRSVFSDEHEAAHVILWPAPQAPTTVLVRYAG
jgi:hypothetical protein